MSKILTVAAVAVAVLSGCGMHTADPVKPSASPAKPQEKSRQFEAMRADCMKQKGFKYIPDVPAPRQVSEADSGLASGDYQAMKQHREKYGFGVFASYVYPKDPVVGGPETGRESPNNPIMMALSETQLKAYRAAEKTCYRQAAKAVLGKDVTSNGDAMDQLNKCPSSLRAGK